MSERAGILDILPIDVSDFAPQPPKEKTPIERLKKVAEQAQFRSREPEPVKPERKTRTYRTGRNMQFNIKADPVAITEFYRIADQQGWVLGEALERAVEALRREVEQGTPKRRDETA